MIRGLKTLLVLFGVLSPDVLMLSSRRGKRINMFTTLVKELEADNKEVETCASAKSVEIEELLGKIREHEREISELKSLKAANASTISKISSLV